MFDMIVIFAIVLIGACVQSVLGFGFGMLVIPLLALFFDPQLVVPMVVVLGTFHNLKLVYALRRHVNLYRMWPLFILAGPGLYLGAYMLTLLDAVQLRLIIGVLIMVLGMAYLTGFRRRINREKLGLLGLGLLSGVLTGAIGVGGPPLIIFLVNQGIDKTLFRANLSAFFAFMGLALVPIYIVKGLLDQALIIQSLWMLPAVFIGGVIGLFLAPKVPEKLFFRVCLSLITILGSSLCLSVLLN